MCGVSLPYAVVLSSMWMTPRTPVVTQQLEFAIFSTTISKERFDSLLLLYNLLFFFFFFFEFESRTIEISFNIYGRIYEAHKTELLFPIKFVPHVIVKNQTHNHLLTNKSLNLNQYIVGLAIQIYLFLFSFF